MIQGLGFWSSGRYSFDSYYEASLQTMVNPPLVNVYSSKASLSSGDVLSNVSGATMANGYYYIKNQTKKTFNQAILNTSNGIISSYVSDRANTPLGPQHDVISKTWYQSNGSGGSSSQAYCDFLIEDSLALPMKVRFSQTGTNTAGVGFFITCQYMGGGGAVFTQMNRTNDSATFDSVTFTPNLTKSRMFRVYSQLNNAGAGTSGHKVEFFVDLILV